MVTLDKVCYTSYWAFCACLNRALTNNLPITNFQFLLDASRDELKQIFIDDNGQYIPMIEERIDLLKQAAEKMVTKYNGTFVECILTAGYDAVNLMNLVIVEFPSFFDVAWYQGQQGKIFPRLRIATALRL